MGKWSMKQLEVILSSRIPSLIGNKIKNHILKILNFSSLFRLFIPFPNALGPMSYPNKQSFFLIASPLFWVCCASLVLSSRSSIAPPTFQKQAPASKSHEGDIERTSLQHCFHDVPNIAGDWANSTPAVKQQGRREEQGNSLREQDLKINDFKVKVTQSLLFLWGYWFQRIFLLKYLWCAERFFSTATV